MLIGVLFYFLKNVFVIVGIWFYFEGDKIKNLKMCEVFTPINSLIFVKLGRVSYVKTGFINCH